MTLYRMKDISDLLIHQVWVVPLELESMIFNLNEKYNSFSSLNYFGFRGRIAYDLNISDKYIVSPQYSFYYGLSEEFDEFPEFPNSIRHFFGIGVHKKVK